MPLRSCPQQHMVDSCPSPALRVLGNPYAARDLVLGGDADAMNVLRQGVRILPHLFDGLLSIGLVDSHRSPGTDSMAVQKEHDLPDLQSLLPGMGNPRSALWADSIDGLQLSGGVANDTQHLRSEVPNQLLRQNWANSFHEAASQVAFTPLARLGRNGLHDLGLELKSVLLMPNPPTFLRQPLPGAYRWQ